jgi:NitT/TauT family transport system substrate-binding protein
MKPPPTPFRLAQLAPVLLLALTLSACASARVDGGVAELRKPLAVYGASGVIELAPVHLTYEKLYPGGGGVRHGGVRSLVKKDEPGDLATNAETQLLLYSLDRPDLRIVGRVAEGLYRIVGRKSAGITSIPSLKGKRIGTMVDSSSGYFLFRVLQSEGLSFDDVELVDLRPFSAIADALVDGKVDAISIWEPHSENAIRELQDDAMVIESDAYREQFNLNTTANVLADPAKRSAIVAFVRNLIVDTRKMREAPAVAQKMVAVAGGYSRAEVIAAWPHHSFAFAFPDAMLDILENEEKWLANLQGRAPRTRSELAPLIDRSIYEEASVGLP